MRPEKTCLFPRKRIKYTSKFPIKDQRIKVTFLYLKIKNEFKTCKIKILTVFWFILLDTNTKCYWIYK